MIRRVIAFVALLVLLAAGFALMTRKPANVMLVENPIARPLPAAPGDLAVVFTLANPGPADALISARLEGSGNLLIVRPEGLDATPIPGDGTPAFALDGVHLRVTGLTPLPEEGALIPITLTFLEAGPLSFKARLTQDAAAAMDHGAMAQMDHSAMDHAAMGHGAMDHTEAAPAPSLALNVIPLADGEGFAVEAETRHFTFFKPDGADMAPERPGEGHAHLYLDGLKIGRMYGPTAEIGPLLPGSYTVRVALNTNMHQPVVVDGKPVLAEAVITVATPHDQD